MLECFLAAEQSGIARFRALELCRNARADGPVACFVAAESATFLSENRIVDLCRCARGEQPVSCWERAQSETLLSDDQIFDLCNATNALGLRKDCLPPCY